MRIEQLREITIKGIDKRKKERMVEAMDRIHSGIYDGIFQKMKEIGEEGKWIMEIDKKDIPTNEKDFEYDMISLGYRIVAKNVNVLVIKWEL